MSKRRLPIVCALLTCLLAPLAHAGQLDDVKRKGELICGVLGTDEPMSFIDPATRRLIGYDVDLCGVVARAIGVSPVIRQISVSARIPELQQGHIDILAASLTHTLEREQVIDFSLTTFVTGQKVMVRRDSGITSLAQLAGQRVVTVKGGTQEPNTRRAIPGVEVVTFETSPAALVALEQRKAAGFVNDEMSIVNAYAKLGPAQKDYAVLAQSISTEPLALGVRKGEPALKAAVNGALRDLEASGGAEQLYLKWFGPGTLTNSAQRPFRIESDRITASILSGATRQWLLSGLALSLQLTALTWLLALPLATTVALCRLSPAVPLRALGTCFVEVIRNIPLLAHLLFWHFAVPELLPQGARTWLYTHGAETLCALAALTLYTASFMAEDIRAGVRAVPRTQLEAARALGLPFLSSMRRVVLPQALSIVIPPLTSQTLNLWKNTSIATVIGTAELMYQAQRVETATFRGIETFGLTTVVYLVISLAITAVGLALQRRYPART
jgi:polar amino acid transport system substrate-binding protein